MVLNEALKNERPPRGLTPNIRHNIPKPPADLIISWNQILFNTVTKLTEKLSQYWTNQKELELEFDQLKAELHEKVTITPERWLEYTDIRQYFKHSISRAEEKEVPETRPTTEPTETDKTSKQSENHEPTIRGISSNKTSITKPEHSPVHPRTSTSKRTKTARCFTKSTNIVNLSKYQLTKDEEKITEQRTKISSQLQ